MVHLNSFYFDRYMCWKWCWGMLTLLGLAHILVGRRSRGCKRSLKNWRIPVVLAAPLFAKSKRRYSVTLLTAFMGNPLLATYNHPALPCAGESAKTMLHGQNYQRLKPMPKQRWIRGQSSRKLSHWPIQKSKKQISHWTVQPSHFLLNTGSTHCFFIDLQLASVLLLCFWNLLAQQKVQ